MKKELSEEIKAELAEMKKRMELMERLLVDEPEIEAGTLCYFWNEVRQEFPVIRPFHSKIEFYHAMNNQGQLGSMQWQHCEPIDKPKLEINI